MGVTWRGVHGTLRQLAQPAAQLFAAEDGNNTTIYSAACPLPARLQHLYECRPIAPIDVQQPRPPKYHWLPIAVDGTKRHEASYVHCTIGASTSPDELAYWWLIGGSEEWGTLYAAAVDFDRELADASKVTVVDTAGEGCEPLFLFMCRWEGTDFAKWVQKLEG